jgi:uncharacterized delta-60 repeat protein
MTSSQKSAARLATRLAAIVIAAMLMGWPSLPRARADAGDLDPSFGSGGKVITDFLGTSNSGRDLLIQPDGKIVVAGHVFNFGRANDYGLARYNADGSPDYGFGSGGKLETHLFNSDNVSSAALEPDGGIVVAGNSQTGMGKPIFSLASYRADGGLKFRNLYSGNEFSFINDVAVQQDGRIIFGGRAVDLDAPDYPPGTYYFYLKRLLPNGEDDLTFANGSFIYDKRYGSVAAIAVQADGKILVATGTNGDIVLLRYNNDGSPDTKFGSGGRVITDISNLDSAAAIALQMDGKIVVAANANVGVFNADSDFAVVRYTASGKLDKKFGAGGKVVTDFGSSDIARALTISPDGDITVAGSTTGNNTGRDFALARYNPDGTPDESFGPEGRVTTDFYGDDDEAYGVGIQDGKVVAAGHARNGIYYFALARYGGGETKFDRCLQDDGTGYRFMFNSQTGEYLFTNCSGLSVGGVGVLMKKGNTISLTDSRSDRRVQAQFKASAKKGTASIQTMSPARTFTITDRDITDSNCACQ